MPTAASQLIRPSCARRVVLDGFVPTPLGSLATAPAAMSWPAKDPGDVLDYEFDISPALAGNDKDSIATIDVTINPSATGDLTLTSAAADGSVAVLWLASGQVGTVYLGAGDHRHYGRPDHRAGDISARAGAGVERSACHRADRDGRDGHCGQFRQRDHGRRLNRCRRSTNWARRLQSLRRTSCRSARNGVLRKATQAQIVAGLQPTLAVPQAHLLGRNSAGSGAPETVALGAGLSLTGGVLSAVPPARFLSTLPAAGPPGGGDLVPLGQNGKNMALPYAQFMGGLSGLAGVGGSGLLAQPTGATASRRLADLFADSVAVEIVRRAWRRRD